MGLVKDPLDELLVDQAEVDRGRLAAGLLPVVRLDLAAKTYALLPGAQERLGGAGTVLVALLARKVFLLKEAGYSEPAQPRLLETETGIPGGTLRPILQGLLRKRLVTKFSNGYVVANWSISKALEEINVNDK